MKNIAHSDPQIILSKVICKCSTSNSTKFWITDQLYAKTPIQF